ncbi:MAG: hypothetical protein M1829_006307 [Trizodia sp. TS-e1964]|nr:MAG: hypothetical protein M1829_006307 [Trizodia sp. TS-e1964]
MAEELSTSSPAPASSADPSRSEMKEDSIPTRSANLTIEASDQKESTASEAKGPSDDVPATSDTPGDTTAKSLKEKAAVAEETAELGEDEDAPKAPGSAEATQPGTNGASNPNKKPKRKSGGIPEHKSKTLKKKASKAALTNLDAQPGDLFLAHLKGFPPWPAIIADEDMLPEKFKESRPVTAKQTDGHFREAFQDGGKRVADRTFPIMYLHTNDFGWMPNTDLKKLDPDECRSIPEKGKKKDLFSAYQIAAENHNLEYFKDLLNQHIEAMQATPETKASKKSKNKKNVPADEVEDEEVEAEEAAEGEDLEMEDAPEDTDMEEPEVEEEIPSKPKSKKRKKGTDSDGDAVPAKPAKALKRSESTKKAPKVKLNVTPKATNGVAASKSKAPAKAAKGKKAPPKAKKAKEPSEETEESVPDEKPLTEAEKIVKKEKSILFYRHKLQKGFLTRDQMPKPEEMKLMGDFITSLEDYSDLEAHIIRSTKINKVLKGIIKLSSIPRDEEFHFRQRSIDLLGAWNKILASSPDPSANETATSNGAQTEKKGGEAETGLTADPNDETADLSMMPEEDTIMENAPDAGETKLAENQKAVEPAEDTVETAEEAPTVESMPAEITV